MAQHDYDISNAAGAVVRGDINNALGAIATNNSGATAPATTYANMWWFDTSTNILKQRDNSNTDWVNVALKDGSGWTPYRQGAVLGDVATLTKDTDGTLSANSDTKVATQKAVKTYADTKIPKTDIDTTTTLGTSDTKVPSQKAVKTYVDTLISSSGDYEIFTASGTFTAPAGKTKALISMCGGGAGGDRGPDSGYAGCGGGGGASIVRAFSPIVAGTSYTVTVGAGGAGGSGNGGVDGGDSSFVGPTGFTITAPGGDRAFRTNAPGVGGAITASIDGLQNGTGGVAGYTFKNGGSSPAFSGSGAAPGGGGSLFGTGGTGVASGAGGAGTGYGGGGGGGYTTGGAGKSGIVIVEYFD